MSFIIINRDLNSTGKKFFISNYLDVKEFWKNDITKEELISRIKNKTDWQDKSDNSIENKISSIKSFFDKKWNLDALKNTISSRLPIEIIDQAKQLFQTETGRAYDESVDKIDVSDEEDESEFVTEQTKTKDMKIPLNQIFYGPPGTGKTFVMSTKSEEIIQNNFNKDSASVNEVYFNRIVTYIRANFNEKDHNVQNGKNLYRNLSRILNIWGYILDAEFDGENILDNARIKLKGSNWPQHYRYVTHFGFVDDWTEGKSIILNSKGDDFKSKIKDWLLQNTSLYISITPDFETSDLSEQEILIKKGFQYLRTHDDPGGNLPDIFIEQYIHSIINEPNSEDISGFIKSIYCALFMALRGDLYGHKSSDKPKTQEEEDSIQVYFDLNEKTKNKGELRDLEWTGWITKNLEELHLIEISNSDEFNNYFSLTDTGFDLVNSIIDRWKVYIPDLFEIISFDNGVKLGFIEFITFHQSYSYEEFIEGIRPNLDSDNSLTYTLEKGVFKRISDRAKRDQNNNYVIIIDEINRGNISKIFGELITLIEPSKRLFTENDEHPKQITLPYSKKLFGVPKNLFILGTMNTADKSIALLDSALRRRFSFTEMLPKTEVIEKNINIAGISVKDLFSTINNRIEFLIDKDHTIGHSYFLKIKDNQTIEALALLFKKEIIPLLIEYFYCDFEKIQLVLGDNKEWKSKEQNNFFDKKSSLQNSLFGTTDIDGYDDKDVFQLTPLLEVDKDGKIEGSKDELTKLFKSVYTKKSN